MPIDEFLLEQVATASAELPHVSQKPIFGCQVFFAKGRAFALIWKGRIGVKLPDDAAFAELKKMPGSGSWTMTARTANGRWVLVPEAFHDDDAQLRTWTHRAHGLALAAPAKKPKAAKRRVGASPKRGGPDDGHGKARKRRRDADGSRR